VKSGQKGKPPGVSSHNAEFKQKRESSYVHVDGATATVETMSLGAITFDLSSSLTGSNISGCSFANHSCESHHSIPCSPRYGYPKAGDALDDFMLEADRTHLRRKPRSQLGDLLARGAEHSLVMGLEIGYPGDDKFEAADETRFLVYRILDAHHLIMDSLCNEDTEIESKLLTDPDFDLQRWYSGQRAKAAGLKGHIRVPSKELEDSLALGVQVALEEGILTYPGDFSEFLFDRFSGFKHDDSPTYWIWDKQHRWSVDISRVVLLDDTFDIIGWYRSGCAAHLNFNPESWMWCNRADCEFCVGRHPVVGPAFTPTYREWGIDWDDADNELLDYTELVTTDDDPESEWAPCVTQTLTRIGDLWEKQLSRP
jgi:hypothetical protein